MNFKRNRAGEKPKNALHMIGKKLFALLELPEAVLVDLAEKICGWDALGYEKFGRINAEHESGHAVIILLVLDENTLPIEKIAITRSTLMTHDKIAKIMGNYFMPFGFVKWRKGHIADEDNIFIALAGLAATVQDHPQEKEKFLDHFINIDTSSWGDMTESFAAIKRLIAHNIGREIRPDENARAMKCLRDIFEKLKEVFEDPHFKTCRDTLAGFLLERGSVKMKKRMSVNQTLKEVLKKHRIAETELTAMRARLKSIDITGIIMENFSR